MPNTQFRISSDMMLASLIGSRAFGQRQVQLDYHHLFRRLVLRAGISHSAEIGAFEGGFSCWLKGKQPGVSAIAYEANPYVAERFAPRCKAAGVDYRHACVSEEMGEVTLSIPRDFRGRGRDRVNQMSSLLSNKDASEIEDVRVPSVRLDQDLALTADDRTVMWIDVEGALGRVLPHTTEVLKRTVLVNVEVESRAIWDGQWLDDDVASFMADQGFVFIARDAQAAYQYNCIFAHEALFDFDAARPVLRRFHSGGFPSIKANLEAEQDRTGGGA